MNNNCIKIKEYFCVKCQLMEEITIKFEKIF